MHERLIELLKRHEGVRLKPYRCTANKLTIGVGRNLEDNGINMIEAEIMLANDIESCELELTKNIPWFKSCPDDVKVVLINMCFNMGWPRLSKFKNTLRYLENKEYEKASIEMLDSRWATQVGYRALELSKILSNLK